MACAALVTCAALAVPAWASFLGATTAAEAGVSERASLHGRRSRPTGLARQHISYGFISETSEGLAPPPLASIVLRIPAGDELHADDARPGDLPAGRAASAGDRRLSARSRLGSGSALVEVPFGAGSGQTYIPEIQAVSGPPGPDGNLVVLFYANGQSPEACQEREVKGQEGQEGRQEEMSIRGAGPFPLLRSRRPLQLPPKTSDGAGIGTGERRRRTDTRQVFGQTPKKSGGLSRRAGPRSTLPSRAGRTLLGMDRTRTSVGCSRTCLRRGRLGDTVCARWPRASRRRTSWEASPVRNGSA